jgi:membrane protein DedA with SNARE-associated domain
MNTAGYFGLFILSLIESAGIPVPSEVVLPFSGFLVASGTFALWTAALVATLGNYAGSIVLYWIGASGGRWILDRYGKYVLIHKEDIIKGESWFNQHGTKAVFFGRLMPIVRTFISLPAGVNKMNFKKFSIYTILGALPWNFLLVYAGYKAGQNWDSFKPYFHIFDIVIGTGVVLFVIWYVIKKRRHAHA